MVDKIKIRNINNNSESTIDADLWKEKKEQYKRTFVEVSKIVEPPEVKALRKKQTEKPVIEDNETNEIPTPNGSDQGE